MRHKISALMKLFPRQVDRNQTSESAVDTMFINSDKLLEGNRHIDGTELLREGRM